MRRRKTPSPRSGKAGDLPTKRTDYRIRLRGRLERAIAKRIGDDSHRWVDITFPYRGESESYYQILDVHHNLTSLDEEARMALDEVTREWDLTLQEEMTAANDLVFQTLTLHSEDPKDHRRLVEAILERVYKAEFTNIDISQVDGESG